MNFTHDAYDDQMSGKIDRNGALAASRGWIRRVEACDVFPWTSGILASPWQRLVKTIPQ